METALAVLITCLFVVYLDQKDRRSAKEVAERTAEFQATIELLRETIRGTAEAVASAVQTAQVLPEPQRIETVARDMMDRWVETHHESDDVDDTDPTDHTINRVRNETAIVDFNGDNPLGIPGFKFSPPSERERAR